MNICLNGTNSVYNMNVYFLISHKFAACEGSANRKMQSRIQSNIRAVFTVRI